MAKYNHSLTLRAYYYHQMGIHLYNLLHFEKESEESNRNIVISASPFISLFLNFFQLRQKYCKMVLTLKLYKGKNPQKNIALSF
jgi:hypothetical protein